MAYSVTKWVVIISILSFAMKSQILIHAQQQVPCFFIFGDSLFGNGNNNNKITLAKTNYAPYGIDYPGGVATGRSTNGRNLADFLAQLLGFAKPIPPFVTTTDSDILRGVNYASAGGGILDGTGANVGERFSLNEQLRNHEATIRRVGRLLGNRTAGDGYLRRCLYTVSAGTDDYVNNYYFPLSLSRLLYTPDGFAQKLIKMYSQQLRSLYELGSRKIAVFDIPLLGFIIPQELSLYSTNGSSVDFINDAVKLFNNRLISLITELNNDLTDAQFIYLNITDITTGVPSATGVGVLSTPCCEVNIITGLCVRNGRVCSNRNEYAYWDNYRPTQIVFNFTASRAYTPMSPSDAIPFGIQTLVQH